MLAYQLGDEQSFRELYARHSGRILGFLRQKTTSEAKARDIFQSTFLKLHRSRSRYNPALPFVPWLFTICRSELLDFWKKEAQNREDLPGALPEIATSASENSEADLSELSVTQRQVLEMRFVQDSTFAEIAVALKTSPMNARQLVSRAVRKLRSIYEKK